MNLGITPRFNAQQMQANNKMKNPAMSNNINSSPSFGMKFVCPEIFDLAEKGLKADFSEFQKIQENAIKKDKITQFLNKYIDVDVEEYILCTIRQKLKINRNDLLPITIKQITQGIDTDKLFTRLIKKLNPNVDLKNEESILGAIIPNYANEIIKINVSPIEGHSNCNLISIAGEGDIIKTGTHNHYLDSTKTSNERDKDSEITMKEFAGTIISNKYKTQVDKFIDEFKEQYIKENLAELQKLGEEHKY